MEFDLNANIWHEDFFQKRNSYKNLIFFGAGYLGKIMLQIFKENDVTLPVAICDNDKNKHGTFIENIEIMSLEEAKNKYDDIYILISTSSFASEIMLQLKKEISKDSILFFHPVDIVNFIGYRDFLKENISQLNKIYDILADQTSKIIYYDVLTARNTGDYQLYIKNNTHPQYFPSDIIKFKDNDVFLDIGAYTGDTIEEYIKVCNGKYQKIIACEPNSDSYIYIEKMQRDNSKIELIKKGISDKKETLFFNENPDSPSSANISNNGNIQIEVDSIDNLISERVSFIKMDIEGFEMSALRGAVNTIKKYKPTLAICLYHKYNDFLDIPKFILALDLGYKLYVRHHSANFCETVLYAICE